MKIEISITPIIDHESYNVNGHTIYKDSNNNWISRTDLSDHELKAFKRYKSQVIENPAFKTHTKATYKI